MKAMDKILRRWRINVALREAPAPLRAAFDIGCDDGFLLSRLGPETVRRDGCDPLLGSAPITPGLRLIKGHFPDALDGSFQDSSYNAIFALAVLEHFSEEHLRKSSAVLADMLAHDGKLIATVPHPFVDTILHVLKFLGLLYGTDLEHHHGFDPDQLAEFFSEDLTLLKRKKFQLGLNNCFVFVKRQKPLQKAQPLSPGS